MMKPRTGLLICWRQMQATDTGALHREESVTCTWIFFFPSFLPSHTIIRFCLCFALVVYTISNLHSNSLCILSIHVSRQPPSMPVKVCAGGKFGVCMRLVNADISGSLSVPELLVPVCERDVSHSTDDLLREAAILVPSHLTTGAQDRDHPTAHRETMLIHNSTKREGTAIHNSTKRRGGREMKLPKQTGTYILLLFFLFHEEIKQKWRKAHTCSRSWWYVPTGMINLPGHLS